MSFASRWSSLVLTLIVGLFFASPAFAIYYVDMADSADLGYVPDGGQIDWLHSFTPDQAVASVQHTYLVVTVTEDFRCTSFGECMVDVFFQEESVVFDIDEVGNTFDGGDVTPGWLELGTIFAGEVTIYADINEWGDTMRVFARSDTDNGGGDFMVVNAAMIVDFTPSDLSDTGGGNTTSPMPEPSAALAFALGGVVFSGSMRGRRR